MNPETAAISVTRTSARDRGLTTAALPKQSDEWTEARCYTGTDVLAACRKPERK